MTDEREHPFELAGNRVDPSVLSGGIWEAPLTTAVGLAVAIPAVLACNWFERRLERLAHEMDSVVRSVFTRDLSAEPSGVAPNRQHERHAPEPEPQPRPAPEPAPRPEPEPTAALAEPRRPVSTPGVEERSGSETQDNTGSGDNTPGGGQVGVSADYLTQLQIWLERHKQYPRAAQVRRQQGTAMLYFVMDREVEEMIRRAQPLSRMPESMTQARLELVVPVQFFLR